MSLKYVEVERSPKGFVIEFDVAAKPGSKIEKVSVNENGVLIIQTRSRPVEGEANKAIIEILSDLFGVPKSHIDILRGDKSKNKRIKLLAQFTANKKEKYFLEKLSAI